MGLWSYRAAAAAEAAPRTGRTGLRSCTAAEGSKQPIVRVGAAGRLGSHGKGILLKIGNDEFFGN